MNIIKIVLISALSLLVLINGNAASNPDCVILLHGLIRSHYSMSMLASTLTKHHYVVINDSYPSTKRSIKELSQTYIPSVIDKCLKANPRHIHFIAHSLGGIILQKYLQNNKVPKLDRIVMLGPPNHGSPLANIAAKNKMIRLLFGPSVQELTTSKKDIPLLQDHYKIGIIAGNASINVLGPFIFKEPNDGVVPVSSTKMKHMDDFIILPVTHPFLMRNKIVAAQILSFLTKGHFCTQACPPRV